MKSAIILTTALAAATAKAMEMGIASVVNKCAYPVYLCNVPAAYGNGTETDEWLPALTGSWSEQYQVLSNGQGWSIKLSTSKGALNIMQYEYTVHNDGTVWWDLSDVNGNPFDGAWTISASGSPTCTPKQHAYMYPTNDQWAEQSCDQDANILVTLCGGPDGSSGSSSSYGAPVPSPSSSAVSSPVAASTTSDAAPTASATTPTATLAAASAHEAAPAASSASAPAAASASAWNGQGWSASEAGKVGQYTTLSTAAAAAVTPAPSPQAEGDVFIVTTTVVAYTTVDVPPPSKRDVHQHHQHHARHPHGGRF